MWWLFTVGILSYMIRRNNCRQSNQAHNDYAAMLLVDSRYAQTSSSKSYSSPTDKLPQWIKARLSCAKNYGEVHRLLHQFFKFNKQKNWHSWHNASKHIQVCVFSIPLHMVLNCSIVFVYPYICCLLLRKA